MKNGAKTSVAFIILFSVKKEKRNCFLNAKPSNVTCHTGNYGNVNSQVFTVN